MKGGTALPILAITGITWCEKGDSIPIYYSLKPRNCRALREWLPICLHFCLHSAIQFLGNGCSSLQGFLSRKVCISLCTGSWISSHTNSSQSDTLQVNSPHFCNIFLYTPRVNKCWHMVNISVIFAFTMYWIKNLLCRFRNTGFFSQIFWFQKQEYVTFLNYFLSLLVK